MKNFLILFMIIFISCGEKQEKIDSMDAEAGIAKDLQLSGNYFVKIMGNEELPSEEVSLTFDEKSKELKGNAGCNRFSSKFEREENKVTFSDPVSTRMFCDGKMEREKQILEILPKISEIKENRENIVFLSAEGEQLLIAEKSNNE